MSNNGTGKVKEKDALIEPAVGDQVVIDITDDKKVTTYIELIEEYTIWTADFLTDIWNYRWRRQAFDVTYMKGERCFSFLAEIEGRDSIENLPVTRMVRISTLQEIQRRASYRLPYSFDIYMRKVQDKHGVPAEDKQYIKCKGMDISETGVGFTTEDNRWNSGDMVQCKFMIADEEYVFDAKVMRRIAWLKDDVYIHRVGIRFKTEDEKQLKKIRRFIFSQQVARKM